MSRVSRFVRPDQVKLDLSGGDWLLVKRQLTTGESRRVFAGMVQEWSPGEAPTLDSAQVGLTRVVEYLIDWSFTGLDGLPVVIRDKSRAAVASILEALDLDSYNEIVHAIDAHEAAQEAARSAEKNGQSGETVSSAISPSAG